MGELLQNYKKCVALLPVGADVYASQEGEDILLKRLFKSLYYMRGSFLDVGAHDPIRFSTTLHYYLKGWRGVNIDPNPEGIARFDEIRPEDINICCGISSRDGQSLYHMFEEAAFNTLCDRQLAFALTKTKLIEKRQIVVTTLRKIFSQNRSLLDTQNPCFLNIDVEGAELDVLISNDWDIFRPHLVLVEALDSDSRSAVSSFLEERNYMYIARTKNTLFFAEQAFKEEFVD